MLVNVGRKTGILRDALAPSHVVWQRPEGDQRSIAYRPIECAVHKHYMIQCGFNNRVAVKLLQFYLTANIALKDLLICGRPQYVYEKNEHYNLGRSS